MKISLQYVNDVSGQTQAVQLPVADWEKILSKLKKYEQALQLKSDLTEALEHVKDLRAGKTKKHTLNEFLCAL